MPRLHLFEFEDLEYFPSVLRKYMQDHLHYMTTISSAPFEKIAERIKLSCLRIYSPNELDRLVSRIKNNTFKWESGTAKVGSGPMVYTYLIGIEKAKGGS